MKTDITLVWFTGTIMEFNVATEDFSHNKINRNLYDKIRGTFGSNLVMLISVANQDEKEIYDKILKDNKISANVIYTNYAYGLDELFLSIAEQFNIKAYIDSARSRLTYLYKSGLCPNAEFIHLSQLIW